MQNKDEDFDGLEEKLSRLKPKQMEEACLLQLVDALEEQNIEQLPVQEAVETYPSNVLWMRFAPVAAAAGVVLLGTFFMHYERNMKGNALQQGGEASVTAQAASVLPVAKEFVLPVPRLGMGGDYQQNGLGGANPGVLPVSAQNYLPLEDSLAMPYRAPSQLTAGLHFAEAYDWQDGSVAKPVK